MFSALCHLGQELQMQRLQMGGLAEQAIAFLPSVNARIKAHNRNQKDSQKPSIQS